MNRYDLKPIPNKNIPSPEWVFDIREKRDGVIARISKRGCLWLRIHQHKNDEGKWCYLPILELRVGIHSLTNSYAYETSLEKAKASVEEKYWKTREEIKQNL